MKKVFRKLIHKIFSRILLRDLTSVEKDQIKISSYPEIKSREELVILINKLNWMFPKREDIQIDIAISQGLELDPSFLPSFERNYLNIKGPSVRLVNKINFEESDIFFCLNWKRLLKIGNPIRLRKTLIFDRFYFSINESNIIKHAYAWLLKYEKWELYDDISMKNFNLLIQTKNHKNEAYCYVTGPSFSTYKNFVPVEKTLKIICNSIVKNKEFLDFIDGPDIITFADPVFHFSSNEYAGQFRDLVDSVYKQYKPFLVVPRQSMPLLLEHYPDWRDRIIGIDFVKNFTIPGPYNLKSKGSANILTLLMLPIAASLTTEIRVIGADGREKKETYFWKHNASVQLNEQMAFAFKSHPSFFRDRDYSDYYEEHCSYLEKLIEYLDHKNIYTKSLTRSHIPILKSRHSDNL